MAALDLPVMARSIRVDEFVSDAALNSSCPEQGGRVPPAGGKAVGELKPVIHLDTLHLDAPAGYHRTSLFRKAAEE